MIRVAINDSLIEIIGRINKATFIRPILAERVTRGEAPQAWLDKMDEHIAEQAKLADAESKVDGIDPKQADALIKASADCAALLAAVDAAAEVK